MSLQRIAAVSLVVLFSLAQAVSSGGTLLSTPVAYAHAITDVGNPSDLRKDKKDDHNKDDDEDDDDDDEDDDEGCSSSVVTTSSSELANAIAVNGSEIMLKNKKDEKDKDKKDKNDNKNDDEDDDDEDDDEGCSSTGGGDASAMTPATTPTGTLPTTEVTGASTGGDSTVALIDERVVLRIFPWMPSGIAFKMRFVDPATVSSLPGKRVGNMVFRIEAQDASGTALDVLPAEVNLSARYADRDVAGASEQDVTLSRLDPATNQWKAAPKLTRAAENNYVAASIMEPGTYAINIP
jgi:hypothetical protein